MRAVGGISSSTPISLSKAAVVLSRFASSETGATPDVSAYLKRAATAFKELVAVNRQIEAHRRGEERLACAAVESNGVAEVKKKEKDKYVEKSGVGTLIESNGVVEKKMKDRKAKKKEAKEKSEVEMKIQEVEDIGKRSEERRNRKENKRKEGRLHEGNRVGLVSASMDCDRKKRKHSDAGQGVGGQMEQHEGKKLL